MNNELSVSIVLIPLLGVILILCFMQYIGMSNNISYQEQEINRLYNSPNKIKKLENNISKLIRTNIKLSEKNKQLTLRLNNAKP